MSNTHRGRGRRWQPPAERFTESDGRAMLAALAESGLSGKAFAREHGIAPHKVFYWRYRLEGRGRSPQGSPRAKAEPKPIGFVKARLSRAPEITMPSPSA